MIVISDYNKGFLNEEDIAYIGFKHPNVICDTKKQLGNWCKDLRFIKLNRSEFENNKEFIDETSVKLRTSTREFEYIILSDILSYCPNKHKVLKQMYKALENSANIIILEKKSNNNLEEIKQLLDKCHFVAINNIELFQNYNLITAKKMHMWDAGL